LWFDKLTTNGVIRMPLVLSLSKDIHSPFGLSLSKDIH